MEDNIREMDKLDKILMYVVFIVMGIVMSELVLIVVIFLWNVLVNLLRQ